MNEFIRLLIARFRLWLLFVRNTDGGPVGAWRLVMWYGRDRFADDAPPRAGLDE